MKWCKNSLLALSFYSAFAVSVVAYCVSTAAAEKVIMPAENQPLPPAPETPAQDVEKPEDVQGAKEQPVYHGCNGGISDVPVECGMG